MSDFFTFKAGKTVITGKGPSASRAAWLSALQIVAMAIKWIVWVAAGGLAAKGGWAAATKAFGLLG